MRLDNQIWMIRIGTAAAFCACLIWGPLSAAGMFQGGFPPLIPGVPPEQQVVPQASDVATVPREMMIGTVLPVNDDAVTSTEVLAHPPLREALRQYAQNMTWQDFNNNISEPKIAIAQSATGLVRNLLLYQHAQSQLSKDANFEMIVDQEMSNRKDTFLAQFDGSEARARMELEKFGTSLEDELERSRRDLVVLYFQQTYLKPSVEITRRRMMQYYRNHLTDKYTQNPKIQFQLIDIQAEKFLPLDGTGTFTDVLWTEARALAQRAARKAEQKLQNGEDFAALVQEYSHGFRKSLDGLWRPIDPGSLQPQYLPLLEALANIDVGQNTGVIAGENRFFIARLISRQGGEVTPFADAQTEIKALLTEQNRIKQLDKLLRDRLDEAILGDMDKFINDLTRLAYETLRT